MIIDIYNYLLPQVHSLLKKNMLKVISVCPQQFSHVCRRWGQATKSSFYSWGVSVKLQKPLLILKVLLPWNQVESICVT